MINERLIKILQYKKDWNLTVIRICLLLTLKSQLITGNLETVERINVRELMASIKDWQTTS